MPENFLKNGFHLGKELNFNLYDEGARRPGYLVIIASRRLIFVDSSVYLSSLIEFLIISHLAPRPSVVYISRRTFPRRIAKCVQHFSPSHVLSLNFILTWYWYIWVQKCTKLMELILYFYSCTKTGCNWKKKLRHRQDVYNRFLVIAKIKDQLGRYVIQ